MLFKNTYNNLTEKYSAALLTWPPQIQNFIIIHRWNWSEIEDYLPFLITHFLIPHLHINNSQLPIGYILRQKNHSWKSLWTGH